MDLYYTFFSIGLVLSDESEQAEPGDFSHRVDQTEDVLKMLSSYGRSENGYWLLDDASYLSSREFASLIADRLCYMDSPSYVPQGYAYSNERTDAYPARNDPSYYHNHGYSNENSPNSYEDRSYERGGYSQRPRDYYHNPSNEYRNQQDLRQGHHNGQSHHSPDINHNLQRFESNHHQYNPESGEDLTVKEHYYDQHFSEYIYFFDINGEF